MHKLLPENSFKNVHDLLRLEYLIWPVEEMKISIPMLISIQISFLMIWQQTMWYPKEKLKLFQNFHFWEGQCKTILFLQNFFRQKKTIWDINSCMWNYTFYFLVYFIKVQKLELYLHFLKITGNFLFEYLLEKTYMLTLNTKSLLFIIWYKCKPIWNLLKKRNNDLL